MFQHSAAECLANAAKCVCVQSRHHVGLGPFIDFWAIWVTWHRAYKRHNQGQTSEATHSSISNSGSSSDNSDQSTQHEHSSQINITDYSSWSEGDRTMCPTKLRRAESALWNPMPRICSATSVEYVTHGMSFKVSAS